MVFMDGNVIVIIMTIILLYIYSLIYFLISKKRQKANLKHYYYDSHIGMITIILLSIVSVVLASYIFKIIAKNIKINYYFILGLSIIEVVLFLISLVFVVSKISITNSFIVFRNLFGFKTKFNIYNTKYKRAFRFFVIYYCDKKRKIILQTDLMLVDSDNLLNIITKYK